jgi:hypothetical protein
MQLVDAVGQASMAAHDAHMKSAERVGAGADVTKLEV